jgi:hypothetical protein
MSPAVVWGNASSPAPAAFMARLGSKTVDVTVTSEDWSLEDAVEAALWLLDRCGCEGRPSLELGAGHRGVWRGVFLYDFARLSDRGWEGVAA